MVTTLASPHTTSYRREYVAHTVQRFIDLRIYYVVLLALRDRGIDAHDITLTDPLTLLLIARPLEG